MQIAMSCGLLFGLMNICISAFVLIFPAGRWVPRFSSSSGHYPLSLACLSSGRLHTCWKYCSPWSSSLLPGCTPSRTASWSPFLEVCFALNFASSCCTFCLVSSDGRSSRYCTLGGCVFCCSWNDSNGNHFSFNRMD